MFRWLGNWMQRSSAENPTTSLANPASWLLDWAIGRKASSGAVVSAASALELSAVWRGVQLLSRDVGKLPLHVYRRLDDGGKERAEQHPANALIRRKPNGHHTAMVFKQILTANAILYGNGYARIIRDSQMRPVRLDWLDPSATYAERRPNGELMYITQIDGERGVLDAGDVLHIRGLSWDGTDGMSLVNKAREAFGVPLAAQTYQGSFFGNGARPSLVLKHPKQLRDDARKNLKKSFEEVHRGVGNSHKVAVLEEGIDIEAFTVTAKDAQMIDMMKFSVRDVANYLGLPPHKLGDSERSSYASLEQENSAYLQESLDPWLVVWEEECTDKLIATQAARTGRLFCHFTREALVRADIGARYTAYNTALQGGWMSRNEVRSRENLNPIEGGDEFMVPLNMAPASEQDDQGGDEPPDDDDGQTEANRQVLQEAVRRSVKRFCVQAKKHVRKQLSLAEIDVADAVDETLAAPAKACGLDAADLRRRLIEDLQSAFQTAEQRSGAETWQATAGELCDHLETVCPKQFVVEVLSDEN